MTTTIKAELRYGYEIHDENAGWLIDQADEFGQYEPSWWDEDGGGVGEQITEQLLRTFGFTEMPGADGYWSRRYAAEEDLPVQLKRSGYHGGQLLLIVKDREYSACVGESKAIDPGAMAAQDNEAADRPLDKALGMLRITPRQEEPAWLLTCYWG